ncbi:MAG: diguanylate cyclase, partial [Myxococcales bacterium]
ALLTAHTVDPLRLVESTCVQVVSLSNRTRYEDSLNLACVALEQLGMPVPLDDLSPSLERELDLVYDHVGNGALERLQDSPALLDDRLLGAAKLMNRAGTTAYFCMPTLSRWFQVRLARLWVEAGYCAAMLSSTGYLICATIALRGDFVTGYLIGCTALATGSVRERGTETARTQHVFGLFNSHWFQPLSEDIVHAHAAFHGLLRVGSLDFACYTFRTSQAAMLDTCANLGEMKQEVATALGFTHRTANRHAEQSYVSYRQLVRALEGKTARPGSFDDAEFDEQAHLLAAEGNTYALCFFHIYRALLACLFRDDQALVYHADEAVALTPHIPGVYPTALANLLHSLALIHRLRSASLTESPGLLEQLNANQTWLAARATDAPMNFAHLYDLVEAERLDALNQPWEAQTAFEQAIRNAQAHQRPWHHALATERAGQFYMRRGLEHAGRPLLVRAHHLYRQWGADGKAHAMQKELPFVETSLKGGSSSARGDVLDNEALLRASQALASETSQPRLVARIVELLGQLTGATDARLLLLDEEGSWHLEGGVRGTHVLERMTLLEAEERRIIATSVLRLGLKTLQPLVSEDAVIDSRFAGDPHFAGLTLCSLLALPVVVRGRISAFLTLEHRLLRAAFTSKRVETVTMLCSQMAISIENVRLYQSLERKVAERTRALEAANHQLEALSATDGLTGIANRRCFDDSLLAEWRRAARSRQPLALAMLDVDWFKRYNDSYGHQAGDECLRTIAALLQAHARRISDLTARYGGEEFAFIAPGT